MFGFHSLVAIRCIPFRSRDTPTAKGQKRARFAVYSGSQTRSDHREKMNQGDIASTQLLEALPSHKNPWLPRAPAEILRHAAKHRKWNATERNENGKSTALNETERNWKRFFLSLLYTPLNHKLYSVIVLNNNLPTKFPICSLLEFKCYFLGACPPNEGEMQLANQVLKNHFSNMKRDTEKETRVYTPSLSLFRAHQSVKTWFFKSLSNSQCVF